MTKSPGSGASSAARDVHPVAEEDPLALELEHRRRVVVAAGKRGADAAHAHARVKFTNFLTHRAMSVCIVRSSRRRPRCTRASVDRPGGSFSSPRRVPPSPSRAPTRCSAPPTPSAARSASRSGPGGIPLARRGHPVTLPLYSDNEPIASGKNTEKGPLNVFNWSAYVNPSRRQEVREAVRGVRQDHDLRERGGGAREARPPARRASTSGSRRSNISRARSPAS